MWDYRVIEKDGIFTIHEVYYNEYGNIRMFSKSGITPIGESLDELRNMLNSMLKALNSPILNYYKIKKEVENANG